MNTVIHLGSILGALLLVATGLSSALAQERPVPPTESAAAPIPTAKQILRVLFDALDTPLSVSETCAGVGTEADDRVIGDFIAGFMAEMGARTGHNWIEIAAEPARATDGRPVWQCRVILRRQHGEEEWGWGVGFQLDNPPPYPLLKESVRCLGSG
ncbi:MAG: hypothetical protein KDJ54_16165 [Candidatus Competibacteraceae bacterium]|nr:hypothetical protein [Candidatus Competibacteraceae bacterium]